MEITLERFAYCSKGVSRLLRTFGIPNALAANLGVIAVWGPYPQIWLGQFADRLASDPVRFRPWKGGRIAEIEWVDRSANACVGWLLNELWQILFPDDPQFGDNLSEVVPRYIAQHSDLLTERVELLSQMIDRPEWLTLAAKMENELASLVRSETATTLNSATEDTAATKGRVEQQALAVLVVHPDWTVKQIAEEVGSSREYLSSKSCPKFRAARAAIRTSRIPGGTKRRDGSFEAEGDDDLDFDAMDERMKPRR
ncbi:MAG: hypothetical protein ACKV2Q_16080 [Planctomycetaceae bacterium]